ADVDLGRTRCPHPERTPDADEVRPHWRPQTDVVLAGRHGSSPGRQSRILRAIRALLSAGASCQKKIVDVSKHIGKCPGIARVPRDTAVRDLRTGGYRDRPLRVHKCRHLGQAVRTAWAGCTMLTLVVDAASGHSALMLQTIIPICRFGVS